MENIKREFAEAPEENWVNTFKKRLTCFIVFWKYLTQPDLKHEVRQVPPQLERIKFPRRKKKTRVKPEDLWTPEEHEVFLHYCKDLRVVCFHAMAYETGTRPGELLALKVGDIKKEISPLGLISVDIWIGAKGKTRVGRTVTIVDALQFYNKWIAVHPNRHDDDFDNAYLFPTFVRTNANRDSKPLEETSLSHLYAKIVEEDFEKMLKERTNISDEERAIITRLQKKPHYPYLLRHDYATQNATKYTDMEFNQIMGWSPFSQMRHVYVQETGNEGNRKVKIRKGLISEEETLSPAQIRLTPQYCWKRREPNEDSDKVCIKCGVYLTQEDMLKAKAEAEKFVEEAKRTQKVLQDLSARQEEQEVVLSAIIPSLFNEKDEFRYRTEEGKLNSAKDLYFRNKEGKFMSIREMYESMLKRAGTTEVATEK